MQKSKNPKIESGNKKNKKLKNREKKASRAFAKQKQIVIIPKTFAYYSFYSYSIQYAVCTYNMNNIV